MPVTPVAALPSTRREIRLRPAMSVTEYTRVMSEGPTYPATFPEAIVDTISLGTPMGSARMAGEISAVPPEPPIPSMPPISSRVWTKNKRFSHGSNCVRRSPGVKTASLPCG